MSHALGRRDSLAPYSGDRGSMVLITERRQALGPLSCKACNHTHPGGIARGVILDEPGQDSPWLLWMLADGWSHSYQRDGFLPAASIGSFAQDDPVRGRYIVSDARGSSDAVVATTAATDLRNAQTALFAGAWRLARERLRQQDETCRVRKSMLAGAKGK